MNQRDVLNKVEELAMIYENGVLTHPYWYIPENKRYLIATHDKLFQGKQELKLNINELAALLLKNGLIKLE